MKIKNIIPLTVVLMLILPGLTVVAKEPFKSASTKPLPEQEKLTISVIGENGEKYSIQIVLSEDELNSLNFVLHHFLIISEDALDEFGPDGKNISVSEKEDLETGLKNVIDTIDNFASVGDDFPKEYLKKLIADVINDLWNRTTSPQSQSFPFPILDKLIKWYLRLCRQPMISVGFGWTWIPRYDYESFFGEMRRLIFMHHRVGFAATARFMPLFGPGFPCWKYGLMINVPTFYFKGLFINFGKHSFINRIAGPQLLVGYGVFLGVIP
ncbi:MAG: hypothetical protein QHH19_01890 [Candidatus Thermoplasmatota archaeon]|jgi:hypothetical protein|nr:hypothetical protein [Candidatus Thermoplasmatota archaeon]